MWHVHNSNFHFCLLQRNLNLLILRLSSILHCYFRRVENNFDCIWVRKLLINAVFVLDEKLINIARSVHKLQKLFCEFYFCKNIRAKTSFIMLQSVFFAILINENISKNIVLNSVLNFVILLKIGCVHVANCYFRWHLLLNYFNAKGVCSVNKRRNKIKLRLWLLFKSKINIYCLIICLHN